MADVKISALPAATTPLAGTEVLPIVQSSTTKKVAISDVTAGRAISASSLTLTTTPLGVGSGGTGLTSLTAGYIPYGNGTGAFGNSANFTYSGTTDAFVSLSASSSATFQVSYTGGALGQFAAGSSQVLIQTAGAYPLTFYTNGTEKMRIASDGSVGIGTTSPGAVKLTVAGDGRFTNTLPTLTLLRSDSTSAAARIRMVGSDNADKWEIATNYQVGGAGFEINYGSSNFAFLSTGGNLGLGVSPSAWITGGGLKAFQFGASGALVGADFSSSDRRVILSNNFYYNSSTGNDTYINAGAATRYQQSAGQHIWSYAGSGSAGGTISFTQAMTLDASGNLGVGSTSPNILGLNRTLTLNSTSAQQGIEFAVSGAVKGLIQSNGDTSFIMGSFASVPLLLRTGNTDRVTIDNSGNVVINTAAIATSATDGFLYVPTCAGTPTGTPTTYTGRAPIVVNTTNNKLYFYSGGAWRDAGP